MKNKPDNFFLDKMSRDTSNWRGPFYVNRKDPRLIVPKINPMLGHTVNFANPYAIVVVILIIGFIAAGVIFV